MSLAGELRDEVSYSHARTPELVADGKDGIFGDGRIIIRIAILWLH